MSRDIVLLDIINLVNNLKQVIPLSIESQEITLKLSQTEDKTKCINIYI